MLRIHSITLKSCAAVLCLFTAMPAFAQRKKPPRRGAPAASAPADPNPAGAAAAPDGPAGESVASPAPRPIATEVPAGSEEASGYSDKSSPSGPLLDVELALKGFQRHLSYSGDGGNALPPYDQNGAPAAALRAGIFPFRKGNFSIGASGTFEYAFGLGSKFKTPSTGQTGTFTTKSTQWSLGPRARYHFGKTSAIGLGLDYGGQNYSVDLPPPTPTDASVPDVAYSYLRPNVEGRVDVVSSLAVVGSAGYLFVLDAGEILSDTYFNKSRSSVFGFDLSLGVAYDIYRHVELRPALDFRRYAFSFQPLTTDPRIASNAVDMYLGISLGVGYWM